MNSGEHRCTALLKSTPHTVRPKTEKLPARALFLAALCHNIHHFQAKLSGKYLEGSLQPLALSANHGGYPGLLAAVSPLTMALLCGFCQLARVGQADVRQTFHASNIWEARDS